MATLTKEQIIDAVSTYTIMELSDLVKGIVE
jgi:ribosomal protein L7/L12